MRVKRQKRFRKAVRFYKACFGFREPFKVLCDGNFQHYVMQRGFGDLKKLLSQALGGDAKAFTTRCVNAELKKLGASFSETFQASQKLPFAKCDHEPLKPGSECLELLVGDYNPEHFFVASQDLDVREKLRIMPGCALIFSKKTSLFVEPPSEFQQQFARADENQRERLKAQEQKAIESAGSQDVASLDLPKKSKKDPSLAIKDRPQFKRKRAKGPNPLSCLKSKKKQQQQQQQEPVRQAREESSAAKKRKRHRKRKIDESKPGDGAAA